MAESILTSINLAGGSFNVFYDTILKQGDAGNVSAGGYDFIIPSGWKAVLITHAHNNGYNLLTPVVAFMPGYEIYGLGINSNGNTSSLEIGNIDSNNRFNIANYLFLNYIVIA